MSEGCMYNP